MKESGLIGRKDGKYFFGEGEDSRLSAVIRKIYQAKLDKAFLNVDGALNALESYRH